MRAASQGLGFRIAALLALALFPIGLIATLQTVRVFERADRAAESNLLALTADAATGEEALFRTAFGAVQAIKSLLPVFGDDPEECQRVLTQYLNDNGSFSFAGYVNRDGIVTCGSRGIGQDVSDGPLYQKMSVAPRPRATINREAPISETSVVSLSVPMLDADKKFDGYVAISLPHSEIFRSFELFGQQRPDDLITFNGEGDVLSSESGFDGLLERMPFGMPLADFVGHPQTAFIARTRTGEKMVFAVVPVISGTVYALGSWKYGDYGYQTGIGRAALPILFPVLMWLASLGVAFMAVERMVIRPIRNLRARMLVFMRSRDVPLAKFSRSTPIEVREMSETWERMALSIVRDEAELEDTIHDRNVLLKEVHHRVKNNLQLIASILNLKIRKSRTPEARYALADIQARVMSLAAVHRALYETSSQGRIRADELLAAIVGKTIEAAISHDMPVDVTQSYAEVTFYPDQAVPLTLAAAEAVTNALKYVGTPSTGKAWLKVDLRLVGGDTAVFEVMNSTGTPLNEQDDHGGSGLGEQLIRGFVQQLDGKLERLDENEVYRVTMTLPLSPFSTDAGSDLAL